MLQFVWIESPPRRLIYEELNSAETNMDKVFFLRDNKFYTRCHFRMSKDIEPLKFDPEVVPKPRTAESKLKIFMGAKRSELSIHINTQDNQ